MADALVIPDEKRASKAYVSCTAKELEAWRAKFGRRATDVARAALLLLCVSGTLKGVSTFIKRLPPGSPDKVLTIRLTPSELWLVQMFFRKEGIKGRPAHSWSYGPFVRSYMNRASDFKP